MTKQICKVLLSYKSLINLFNYFVYLAYFKKSLSLTSGKYLKKEKYFTP